MKKYLQIYGKRVVVEIEGRGKPLLMLHGWGGNKDSWTVLKEQLEQLGLLKTIMTIAVDLPGFGESEEPTEPWDVNAYAVFVEKLITELYKDMNLEGDFDLIGHSFGGRIAFKLLSPEFNHQVVQKVDRLILVAAAGIKPLRTWKLKIASAFASFGKVIQKVPVLKLLAPQAKKILYKVLRTHDYEQSSGIMRATFLKVIDEDLQASIGRVKNSTLIFWGSKDSYVPVANGQYMQQKILGSKLIVYPDGKHGIHKTKAPLMAVEISKFFNPHV